MYRGENTVIRQDECDDVHEIVWGLEVLSVGYHLERAKRFTALFERSCYRSGVYP